MDKSRIDENALLDVVKALDGAMVRAEYIALALRVKQSTVDEIKKKHRDNYELWSISIFGAWLRGEHGKKGVPYTEHKDEEHKCPSWWNLVYVVALNVGGNNFSHAEDIAKKEYLRKSTTSEANFAHYTKPPLNFNNDAQDVISKMEKVWGRWFYIGLILKVPTNVLDDIARDYTRVEDRFREMIKRWFEGRSEKNWKQLLIAIDAHYGGQYPELARQLCIKLDEESKQSGDPKGNGQAGLNAV